jgi:hypothetical protein
MKLFSKGKNPQLDSRSDYKRRSKIKYEINCIALN